MRGPSLGPGQFNTPGSSQGVPGGRRALGASFEHAGRQPWQLHSHPAGSSGKEESCWAATPDPSPLRNPHPPNPKCAWSSPSCLPLPHMAENRLSKMSRSRSAALNKIALRHWFGRVGFFLPGGGQCQGPVPSGDERWQGGDRAWGFWSPAASACSLSSHPAS